MEHVKEILKHLHEEFWWLIWGLVIVGMIWLALGGANDPKAHEGAYLKPPAPLDTGEAYGTYYVETPKTKAEELNLPQAPANIVRGIEAIIGAMFFGTPLRPKIDLDSPLAKQVLIDGKGGVQSKDPGSEYIRLITPDTGKAVQISGLGLEGTSFAGGIAIPKGVTLAGVDSKNSLVPIVLLPSGRAIITTGTSPLGYSFQVNLCSGYLNEQAVYTPALRSECPDNSECKTDITKGFSYASCVTNHQNDTGFYTNEWRVFLGRPAELWESSNDTIKLVDSDRKNIDVLTY